MIYTNVTPKTHEAITKELKNAIDAEPILIVHMSDHPDDNYLYLYIAKQGNSYVAGLANASGKHIGLYENHYGLSFKRAMEITTDKIKNYNYELSF